MKKSRYTEEQIIGILKQHEAGVKTAELCREHGISAATFYGWKSKYGGMDVSEAQRLKALEDENRRLKLLVAELSLHGEALKGVIRKKRLELAGLREAVAYAQAEHGLSERTACKLLGVERSSYRYEPRPDRNAELRAALVKLARQKPRYGYRRLHAVLGRGGHEVNVKRVYRLYVEERLMVRRKRRKRLVRDRAAAPRLTGANQEWAMDFIVDGLATGRMVRILSVVDVYTRECLALEADTSLGSGRVTRVLEQLIGERGRPENVRSDNGPEFTSRRMLAWSEDWKVGLVHIQPGRPTQNGHVESFHGRLRDECLNASWFRTLNDVRITLANWRQEYNWERPHSSLGYQTPEQFRQSAGYANVEGTERLPHLHSQDGGYGVFPKPNNRESPVMSGCEKRGRSIVLGLKAKLRKFEAEDLLAKIIRQQNCEEGNGLELKSLAFDDSVTFAWFVEERFLPMQRGRWRPATKKTTEYEINKYLVSVLGRKPLRTLSTFDLQIVLNDLAQRYSDSVVRHSYVNLKAILRTARRLKFVFENPGDDLKMPETKTVQRPTLTQDQIAALLQAVTDPHDLCLLSIGIFCGVRTSEVLGLQWRSWQGDQLIPYGTVHGGIFFVGKMKTGASCESIPVPESIRVIIERWSLKCDDSSPGAFMFPTFGRKKRVGQSVPREGKNFLRWRIHPIAERLNIPKRLITFQVMRRTLGTDLQRFGTMKDAQRILRHADMKTTGNVYMQAIPASVMEALNRRTDAILEVKTQS